MRFKLFHALPLAAALTVYSSAFANWEIAGDTTQGRFEASEQAAGRLLNRESGKLNGKSLELIHRWSNQLAIRLKIAEQAGTVSHQGTTQSGLPFASVSNLELRQLALGLAQEWPLGGGIAFEPSVNLVKDNWSRSIVSVGFIQGLDETLRTTSIEPSVRLFFRQQSGFGETVLSAFAGLSRPIGQSLSVSLGTPYDHYSASPSKRWSHRFGVSFEQTINTQLRLSIAWEIEKFRVGPSSSIALTASGVPVGTSSYPGAERTRALWSAGLRLLW